MRRLLIVLGLAFLLAGAVGLASAQTDYDLSWWTVDGGGGLSSGGGGYRLSGTAGQPDTGAPLESGSYTLTGGFWSGAPAVPPEGEYTVYLPVVRR